MSKPKSIHIVYADWCPHCLPVTVEPLVQKAAELGIPCALHNIDTEEEAVADDLVKKYGDWTPDYLVPQVFLEYEREHSNTYSRVIRKGSLSRKGLWITCKERPVRWVRHNVDSHGSVWREGAG